MRATAACRGRRTKQGGKKKPEQSGERGREFHGGVIFLSGETGRDTTNDTKKTFSTSYLQFCY